MTEEVPARYEVDGLNDLAILHFGEGNEYVMVLCRDNLHQLLTLGAEAMSKLDDLAAPERPSP